jgi:hypothetical protein
MKPTMTLGIVLIVLGLAGLIFPVIKYTTREKVVDLPGVQITADKQNTLVIPAIAGGLALAGGIAVVVAGSRKG